MTSEVCKTHPERTKHSKTGILAFMLIIYMLVYFYLNVFIVDEENIIRRFTPLLLSAVIFGWLFYNLFLNGRVVEKKLRRLFFLYFICNIISFLVTQSGFEKTLNLGIILMSILMLRFHQLKESEKASVYYLFAIAILLILLNGTTVENIVVGKFNPNTCGFLLAILFCVSTTRFFETKHFVDFVILAISFALQFIFTSRTAMLGCLLFVLLLLLFKRSNKSFRVKTVFWLVFIVSLGGVLFAYIYSEIMFPLIGHSKIIVLGKDLFTGRQTIWNFAFESIRNNLWFGVGSHLNEDKLSIGYYDSIVNAHNQPLGVLGAFGIITFLLFYLTLAAFVAYCCIKKDNTGLRTFVIFILVISIMSYFELYFFSQYNWIAIVIGAQLIANFYIRKRRKFR